MTGVVLAHCILGNFLGVVCHCFPPPLDVPTFAARCPYVRNDARDPSSERWNCGREMCPIILPKFRLPRKSVHVTQTKYVCRHFEQFFTIVMCSCFLGNQKDPASWWSSQLHYLWWLWRRRPAVIQRRYTKKQSGELFPYLGNLSGIRTADLSCHW